MVVAESGRAVVLAAMGQRRLVKRVDHRLVLRLERQMVAPRQLALRRLAVRGGHEQFIGPEIAVARAAHRHLQGIEDGLIEGLAGG
ncbi:hypothetical protein G6F45_013963 [Rhizopus arrhizus]|nr:hypothetical protein G6F59_017476 [Rhizopus arrhizus]KAG1606519.1 hypothetical protein G6F45_013963 [Rhizopus arrhizus]